MMLWIVLIFVALPVTELILLLKVGTVIGLWKTVALIVVTAFVGASMWRSQGTAILSSIQARLADNQMPAQELLEGVLILLGGAFFLTPGFITDTFGFVCLIPTTRRIILGWLKDWLNRQIKEGNVQVYVSGGSLSPWDDD
jgi:UPF0716 protein FxsA